MSCGAYGIDDEGRLISCVQCGQSYHPYCVEVKVGHDLYSNRISIDMISISVSLVLQISVFLFFC